jgi:hypothetical protein
LAAPGNDSRRVNVPSRRAKLQILWGGWDWRKESLRLGFPKDFNGKLGRKEKAAEDSDTPDSF